MNILVSVAGIAAVAWVLVFAEFSSDGPAPEEQLASASANQNGLHTVDWYIDSDVFNPDGKTLAKAGRADLQAVLDQTNADLDAMQLEASRIQARLAKARVLEGRAEPYVPSETSLAPIGDEVAVVLTAVDAASTWVVRLTHEEFPERRFYEELCRGTRRQALDVVRQVIQGASD